jgi:putative endonuclease
MKQYHVYIMSNESGTLYTGVTNNLLARAYQHKARVSTGFTSRYNVTRLVFYESCNDVVAAIAREKQIKGWKRNRKIALIEEMNPRWEDLSSGWSDEGQTLRSAQGDKVVT